MTIEGHKRIGIRKNLVFVLSRQSRIIIESISATGIATPVLPMAIERAPRPSLVYDPAYRALLLAQSVMPENSINNNIFFI